MTFFHMKCLIAVLSIFGNVDLWRLPFIFQQNASDGCELGCLLICYYQLEKLLQFFIESKPNIADLGNRSMKSFI